MFVADLFCHWIRARQAASSDSHETVELLLAWMDNDEYGFCHQLEDKAVNALNKKGLAAFAREVRVRFDAAVLDRPESKRRGVRNASYDRRRFGEMLKTVLAAQRDIGAYTALCDETELLPVDCEVVAGMFQSRRNFEDALAWVERGLELQDASPLSQGSSYRLADIKRTLLAELGRADEALASAWKEFERHPSEFTYRGLMKYVPRGKRAEWHERAMCATADADLSSVIKLWLETKEVSRLVERLRAASDDELEELSHYTTEPVAKKVARSNPDVAAKVYRALGMRILNAKKSKYYDAALSNFAQAMRCYEKAGLASSWAELVANIRRIHGRKVSFMPGFERVVAGKRLTALSNMK